MTAGGGDPAARPPYLSGALGLGMATGIGGFSFGVLAVGSGLSVAQACVMSLLVFTGGSQFAVVGVISAGGAASTAISSALLLGARNAAYGLSVASLLPRPFAKRALASHLVIDESVAMARAQPDAEHARGAFYATGIAIFILWNLGTLAGALVGGALDPERFGLDALFPAAFLALLAPQLRQPGAPAIALAGALIAVVLIPFTPAGVPILASAFALLLVLRDPARNAPATGAGTAAEPETGGP